MPARATAEALRNLTDPAKGHGIKADELRWTGFQDFLDALPPGSTVTKEAALAAITDPPLTETVLGDPANLIPGAFGGSVQRSPDTATRYEQYTTPGYVPGTYRERLITLEPPAPHRAYQSSHWPATPNVLLHIRHADRALPDGSTALDIEEFQSDWHQEGRDKGYNDRTTAGGFGIWINSGPEAGQYLDNPDSGARWEFATEEEARELADEMGDPGEYEARPIGQQKIKGVPPAPYADTSKGWALLAARRILRVAAERGLRTVLWTDGATQADRYDLSKQVQSIGVIKTAADTFALSAQDPAGNTVIRQTAAADELPPLIGKDLAAKIISDFEGAAPGAGKSYSGLDLRVGGEGMIEFYDRIMPRVFATLGKPYAAAPATVQFAEDAKSLAAVNDRAREIADHIAEYGEYESLDLSEDNVASRVFGALIDDPELSFSAAIDNERAADPDNSEQAERSALIRFVGKAAAITRHRFDIPPAMAADILAGQPRFSLQPRETAPADPANAAEEIAKRDAEYMAAVERGDMETAQRIVDEAAIRHTDLSESSSIMYEAYADAYGRPIEGARVFDEKGKRNPMPDGMVFPRTAHFVKNTDARHFWKIGDEAIFYRRGGLPPGGFSRNTRDNLYEKGVSVYPTPSPDSFAGVLDADWYFGAGKIVAAGSDGEPVIHPIGKWVRYPKDTNPLASISTFRQFGEGEKIVRAIIGTDPVTYDDRGRVIPLSERFSTRSPDIRYSVRARAPLEQARAAVDAVPPKADGSVDMEARQRALDEWKSANPEAAQDADTGEAIQGRAGMRYRSFDSPDEATGIDRSSSTRPFLHGGAYEIEYSGTAKPIGPSQPEGGRGTIDPASVTRVFYEPEYWTPETRAQRLASDLPQLRSMFPNAEFVAVRLADDAETRVASPLALRPDGTLAGVQEQDDIRFSIRRTSRRDPASNVEALITARILAGKPAAPADVAAILKNAGIRTVDTPEQILDRANARAQALPAAEAGRIRAADPALFERLANDAERDRLAARIGESFGAGAQAAAPAIGAAAALALARERTARAAIESAAGFTAAEMQAELGIDLAATVLNTPDIQPTPAELDARANEREAARREAELNADLDAEADPAPLPPSPEMTALLNQILAAAEARAAAEALERQRRDMEKQRKAARRAESTDDPALDDDPDAEPAPATEPDPVYRLVAPLISNPDEFAQFIREWVRRRLAKTRPEDDPAAPFRHPAALRDLQRTAQHILADLARQLLGTGGPRIAAEHAIARLADAPTERSTIRDIADIYSRIHRGALRESRKDMISRLQREIARLAKDTGRWQENKEDLRRKVTAATERWARTLSEYIALSPDRLLGETRRLQKIIADADTDPADPAAPSDTDDRKLREALDKLAILQTYGGMINWMPGQIAEAADSITAHLNGERQAHEARRLEAEAAAARIRGTLIKAVSNPDESAPAPEPGGFSRFADSLIGNLQLRLNYLIRFAKGTDRQDAIAAIDDIMTELGRGAEQYRVIQSDAHEALGTALEQIYGDRRAAARRLDTPIPDAANRLLSRQNVRLTYGRALQLYASILQRHYAENVRIHKRARDLDTLRTVLDSRDLALHQWLVAWYAAQRGRLSEAQKLVTGCPVLSEDRLYMPAVILREPSGFRGRHAAWTPIAASLTPRVRHRLDFDERASVLDVFADRLEDNALIRAYGPRGIFLRDAVAHQSVQSAVTRFHGSAQRSALMNQLEDTLRGGRQVTRSDAWLAPANTARRWISRFYLSGNILSAAKQIASVPVWANIVGFRNLARYMFDIDSAAIRELMQSPGFRARYASGWSEETANILSDHRRNPVAKLYDAGLLPNRTVDAVAGLWIAQGVYRDLKATLTDRGYSADEARSRAQTLTWNLIEQTQQSARTEMLLLIQREQPLTRVIFQFANSPIQQMQFELEAFREFKAGTPGSRPRLARALIINHVLVPAILLSIEGFFNALLGRQPEDDRWRHWLVASILGQFSALFIIGSLGERGLITLLCGKYPYWKTDELPLAGIKRPFQSAFDLIRHTALYGADALTPGDFSEVTADDILTDLHNLGRATVAPYRHISEAVRNRRD